MLTFDDDGAGEEEGNDDNGSRSFRFVDDVDAFT